MQSIHVKPTIVILISLIVGFLLGVIVTGFYTRHRIDELMAMNTQEGLKKRLIELIDPDKGQEAYVDSLVEVFAQRNTQIMQIYKDSLDLIRIDLHDQLEQKLNEKQKRKIEKTPELSLKNIPENRRQKLQNIVNEIRKDSVSSTLLDSLLIRRQEIRQEKPKSSVKRLYSERSLALKEQLQLTEEQFVKVDSINRHHFRILRSIQADSSLTKVQLGGKLMKLRKEHQDALRPILTVEQFEKYQAIEKERVRERIKERKKNNP